VREQTETLCWLALKKNYAAIDQIRKPTAEMIAFAEEKKASREERERLFDEEVRLFNEYLPLIYKKRDLIMTEPRFYSIRKPTALWGTMYASMGGMGSHFVTLGELIELWEKEPAFTATCKCGGIGVLRTFVGSPLSGSLWRKCTCTVCGEQFEGGYNKELNISGWRDMVAIRNKYHPKKPVAENPATYTELIAALEGRTLEEPPPPPSGILSPGQSYIQLGGNPNNRITLGTVTQGKMDAHDYFERGNESAEKEEYDAAITDFTEAIRLEPDVAAIYNRRGIAYHAKKEYDQAIADFTEAIRHKPDVARFYYSRGIVYNEKDEYDAAIADFTEAIRLKPDVAVIYNSRGMAHHSKDEYDKAIADWSKAIELEPNDAGYYYERAFAYNEKHEYDKVIADCSKAIELKPNDAGFYYNRGVTYARKNDYTKALADLDESLRLEPGNASRQERRNTIAAKLNG
jgi:tetratricopeptide (TPR) repeat protein